MKGLNETTTSDMQPALRVHSFVGALGCELGKQALLLACIHKGVCISVYVRISGSGQLKAWESLVGWVQE